MFKLLSRDAANFILRKTAQKEKFERIKKIEKLLGQADREDASTYTSIPYKLESMTGNIDIQLKDVNI